MAKKVISVSLDDTTLDAIDEFARIMGLSRSAAINMQLNAVNTGELDEIMSTMFSALRHGRDSSPELSPACP